jgi:hypothetical protein
VRVDGMVNVPLTSTLALRVSESSTAATGSIPTPQPDSAAIGS